MATGKFIIGLGKVESIEVMKDTNVALNCLEHGFGKLETDMFMHINDLTFAAFPERYRKYVFQWKLFRGSNDVSRQFNTSKLDVDDFILVAGQMPFELVYQPIVAKEKQEKPEQKLFLFVGPEDNIDRRKRVEELAIQQCKDADDEATLSPGLTTLCKYMGTVSDVVYVTPSAVIANLHSSSVHTIPRDLLSRLSGLYVYDKNTEIQLSPSTQLLSDKQETVKMTVVEPHAKAMDTKQLLSTLGEADEKTTQIMSMITNADPEHIAKLMKPLLQLRALDDIQRHLAQEKQDTLKAETARLTAELKKMTKAYEDLLMSMQSMH